MKVLPSVAGLALLLVLAADPAAAASPRCSGPNENFLRWPVSGPGWEMCWLRPNHSSGPRGSGMELRDIHYRGVPVLRRAHAPLLFAEYRNGQGGNCYRDWKDEANNFIGDPAVRNQLGVSSFPATTSCDLSTHPTQSYGLCPYTASGAGFTSAQCFSGLAIEDEGDRVVLTTQYQAAWYQYTSRAIFHADGTIELEFGFGNSNGTFNNVTHWHHNYWRLDWAIDGPGGDQVYADTTLMPNEFVALREHPRQSWSVFNPAAGFGFELLAGANDFLPANESGRGFHTADLLVTRYVVNEFGDNPNYSLGDCGMNNAALVDPATEIGGDPVFYYRVSVRDATANNWPQPGPGAIPQDSMICKSAGPRLRPIGDWPILRSGFD